MFMNVHEAMLRGVIRSLVVEAAKSSDDSLLSSKVLGYAAEWAVYVASGGADDVLSDSRIVHQYENATVNAQAQFDSTYQKLKLAARAAIVDFENTSRVTVGSALESPGAGTRPVDVETTRADIHVKYNDFKRLIGFQKQDDPPINPGEEKSLTSSEGFSGTAGVYDASLMQFFDEIDSIAGQLSSTSRKWLTGTQARYAAARERHMRGSRLGGRSAAKKFGEDSPEYEGFLQLRVAYQEAVKIVGRDRFYEILDANGFKDVLLKEIEQLIFRSQNVVLRGKKPKTIIFAKFAGPDSAKRDFSNPVTCKFYDYNRLLNIPANDDLSSRMEVVETGGGAGATTTFYKIVDINNPSIVYFEIEFRLDGDSHPPQLKVGKGMLSY